MLIIVEGIDRVGKTTLCDKLHQELGIPIFKNENFYAIDDSFCRISIELSNCIINLAKCMNKDLILDRFHLSEFVYGVCDRNYKNFDVWKIDEKLIDEAILIMVNPINIEMSSKEHGGDLSQHLDLFFECFERSKIINKFECDYNSLGLAVNFVKNKLN